MKKTLLTLSIAAVFAVGASAAEFKAGTYTAKAPGIHGDVTVTVTFTKDKIADVKVTHSETPGIGSKAAELLPGRIVERQSPQVDGVTGATITSTAIRTAVADTVKQAGADPAALVPLAVKKQAKNETVDTDVVVVGGGGAGMSATIRTRMNGLNVVLVEKMPFIGGAASISGGQVVAQGSKLQKAFGVTDDSVESMVKDFQANGHNLNDLSKLTLYAKNVGPTIDWLHDQVGVKFIPNDLPFLAEYSHRRALEFQGGAGTMAQHLREVIGSNGAKVLFNTRVEKLIVEDGKVTGVEAVDRNTGTKEFRDLVGEIATLLCYEATRDLPLEEVEIETPITMAKTKVLAGRKLALVPILRAGMGMLDGMLTLLPAAKVGFIGLYRDEETLQPVEYFCKLPQDIAERDVLVLDPMLATGGSAIDAITQIKKHGAKHIKFIGLIAAPEGIKALHEAHPDVDIYLGAQDDHLNENGYIVPGLGDAGDRIYGTK